MKEVIVGYIGWNDGIIRTETMKNWYDKKPSATPAKIYVSEKVAQRYYNCVKPVYVKVENETNDDSGVLEPH